MVRLAKVGTWTGRRSSSQSCSVPEFRLSAPRLADGKAANLLGLLIAGVHWLAQLPMDSPRSCCLAPNRLARGGGRPDPGRCIEPRARRPTRLSARWANQQRAEGRLTELELPQGRQFEWPCDCLETYDAAIANHQALSIRAAAPADAPRLAPLLQAFNGPRSHTVDLAESGACAGIEVAFIAEHAEDVVGFACMQVVRAIGDGVPHAELTELYVRDQDRRSGVGRALVAVAEDHARAQGAHKLWLVTGFDNVHPQAFYRALGYADRALTLNKSVRMTNTGDHLSALTRPRAIALLEAGSHLVNRQVHAENATYGGWTGREVLIHLAVYARLVGAILHALADGREPTPVELFGRQLTEAELRLSLDDQNAAVQREYAALDWQQALDFWRAAHAHVATQLARLTDAQLAAPGPVYPPDWARPHLSDIVVALCDHYGAHMTGEP